MTELDASVSSPQANLNFKILAVSSRNDERVVASFAVRCIGSSSSPGSSPGRLIHLTEGSTDLVIIQVTGDYAVINCNVICKLHFGEKQAKECQIILLSSWRCGLWAAFQAF
ncbi:hypothetical protein HPB50_027235 [Hyalomma asiaticum]|uniref:Uncharacterized protein n=1 Tax=Hyalomma asiaticum TaxID=266040 RepID=A0ACB7SG63_HYAAI|nr:hypothetical protein HPB50_027235 [Hyalomma asiaticum]